MVAITVVLAATVYLWVSGFGSNQSNLVQASFGAKAVDLPSGDADSSDDVIQLTYVSGPEDLNAGDVAVSIDGVLLLNDTSTSIAANFFPGGTAGSSVWCTTNPGGDADALWERGGSVYMVLGGASADCTDGIQMADIDTPGIDGVHQITISVKGQVVLDTSIEVHDDGSA
jgi:FlaG/FlaF family flagellin (archaellin)